MPSGAHRKLIAWQEAMNLAEAVYDVTSGFPPEERFGLVIQLRRAAVSIPSNLAEGAGRNSARELLYHVGVASGSLAELDTQLELAERLGYFAADDKLSQARQHLGKLLVGLRRSIARRVQSGA